MSLTNPKTAISEQDLKDFYEKIKPFLAPKAYAGFTPIGTIISVFGEYAPANYLICDGSTYNVADYPELCAHLWNLTTNSQYKVSGDATKFKVPDLRGEFLRGNGSNSHTNQGNGANVGVHQNATEITSVQTNDAETTIVLAVHDTGASSTKPKTVNADSNTMMGETFGVGSLSKSGDASNVATRVTTRPTNTSVLFCIATKNIYLDPKNDYSTEEKVVGTWVNGKTLYQRTIDCGALPNNAVKNVDVEMSGITVVKLWGIAIYPNNYDLPLPYTGVDASESPTDTSVRQREIALHYSEIVHSIVIRTYTDRSSWTNTYVTIQYTKNT